ncbi:site-specific integrase [bacterium]|nr:site-specific integrase [bacterium]
MYSYKTKVRSNIKNAVEPVRNKQNIFEIENYLGKNNYRNKVIWIFGINTGLRVSDILGLNVGDVRNKSYICLKEKKTGKFKQFLLNRKLKGIIEDFIENRPDEEPLFESQKQHRLDRSQAYRMLNQACRAVGVKETRIGTHTMRKTFGYHHYKQFKDVAILQEIFNHSSPKITLRYIGINQDEINDSYSQFEL